MVSIALLVFCPVYMQFFLIETVKVAPKNNHESGCCMKVVDFLNQRYKSMRKAAEIVMFSPTLRGMATVTFFYKLGMSGINNVLLSDNSLYLPSHPATPLPHVAEDDASLVKQIGQSFQYSKIESVLFLVNIHASSMYGRLNIDRIHFLIKARREEQIQAAHDETMFGASALPPPTSTDSELERENEKEVDKKAVVTSLLSET
ncbi:hypothetical protein HN873_023964, partial [Arachis hypogaea]